jgi:hypothetical protein
VWLQQYTSAAPSELWVAAAPTWPLLLLLTPAPLLRVLRCCCAEQLINEKPQIIQDYESGKAIPNPQILSKLSRVLGVTLRKSGK